MRRLIDADAIVYDFGEIDDGLCKRTEFYATDEAIAQQPTIDAVPVKRGMWIKADSQQYFRKHYPCFTCSACGYRKDSQKKWNYCPNCGADMRGESDD